jgi:acyl-CoA synthetase (AMP-forming)/AMP-acid ligase II
MAPSATSSVSLAGVRDGQTLAGPPLEDAPGVGALTLGGLLMEQCARFPDHEALVFDDALLGGTTVRWAYRDVEYHSRRVAKALLGLGVGKGGRVGIVMGNRPEAVAALFGAALAGAVAVPLSTFAPKPELSYQLAHADIGVLLLQTTMGKRRFATDVAELCPAAAAAGPLADAHYPYLRHVVAVGPTEEAGAIPPWDAFLRIGDAVDDALLDAVIQEVHPSDSAVAVYSSGTTAHPKGVLHNHRAVSVQFWVQAQLFGRDERTRVWCALPLFWTAGMNVALGATLAGGATWVMQERFDAGEALRLMERERVTEPHIFAHQARALEEHPDWATTDLSSCTKVFGKSVFTRHPSVTGDPNWNMPVGYGMSETSSFFTGLPHWTPRDVFRKGSYGRLLPGNELRVVVPETGQRLGANEVGELLVRGPTLMEHYVKQTRADCFDADGFYHTGDVGYFDDDGLVYWGGRRAEMIKTGGANVSPAEIEVQLQAFEPVKLSRAVGIPDDERGEIVVVCVELKEGATATEAEVQAFLRDRLAGYKVPTRVLFFADGGIPLNRSGTKVKDEGLIATVVQRLGR